jgi:NAD(P)H-flavin reductase/formate hydrogenlyase subunit 6/NADH:ubiquinone oxidoreductase subunit I
MSARFLPRESFATLVDALRDGRRLLGPRVRDGAITFGDLEAAEELPIGIGDEQSPGRYRLRDRGDDRAFGYAVGPTSLKETLFPPRETLFRAERRADGKVGFVAVKPKPEATAVLGARACELAAIGVQDRVFVHGVASEPRYRARRDALRLVVAVQCTSPAATCFCGDAGTGPRVHGDAADLIATEVDAGLVLEARTDEGARLLDRLPTREVAGDEHVEAERDLDAATTKTRTGRLAFEGLPERLFAALDHARWDEVAARCLACGNCTSVCPTCFCSHAEEAGATAGALEGRSERVRVWESCFSSDHGAMHGANPRATTKDRYRQWLTHKLGSWVAQFGTSGCVGCGRCTTWCPAGIDLVEEARALDGPVESAGSAADGFASPVVLPEASSAAEPADREGPLSCDAPRAEDLVPRAAEVLAITRETSDVVTLHVRDHGVAAEPGQFLQLSLPTIGEAPISVSGVSRAEGFVDVELTIRGVGATTRALTSLEPGAELGVRGPYGRGWPLAALEGAPVVIVAGGVGLAPLRGAIRALVEAPERFPDVRLFVGARAPEDLLYPREMITWLERSHVKLTVTVDHASPAWRGHVGVVTRLLRRGAIPEDARALVCGPEIMMRFTSDALLAAGVAHDRQWLTMERHMKCAVGFCGRCQMGPHLVCRDGPVFRRDELALLGREGF